MTCTLDHLSGWNEVFPLMEFTYNTNYHTYIDMAPYETLYERKCRTPFMLVPKGIVMLVWLELL